MSTVYDLDHDPDIPPELRNEIRKAAREAVSDAFKRYLDQALKHLSICVQKGQVRSVHLIFQVDGSVRVDIADAEGNSHRPYAVLDRIGSKFTTADPISLPTTEDFFDDKAPPEA